jgi:hypothetical protein
LRLAVFGVQVAALLIEVLPQRHEERLTTDDADLHEFGKILSP